MSSIVREGVGTRADSLDLMYFDLRDDQCQAVISDLSISYTIGFEYSVRNPNYPTLTFPEKESEVNNDLHWGSYMSVPAVLQELQLTDGNMIVMKGQGQPTPIVPPVKEESLTNYLACRQVSGEILVKGAPGNFHVNPADVSVACRDLCTWEGENKTPHCDTQVAP